MILTLFSPRKSYLNFASFSAHCQARNNILVLDKICQIMKMKNLVDVLAICNNHKKWTFQSFLNIKSSDHYIIQEKDLLRSFCLVSRDTFFLLDNILKHLRTPESLG